MPPGQVTTYSDETFFYKRRQDVGADGDHDVPEVDGGDSSSLGTVPLHEGLLGMLQLDFLKAKKAERFTSLSYYKQPLISKWGLKEHGSQPCLNKPNCLFMSDCFFLRQNFPWPRK